MAECITGGSGVLRQSPHSCCGAPPTFCSQQSPRRNRRRLDSRPLRAATGPGAAGGQRSRARARRSRGDDCAAAWVGSSASAARARLRASEQIFHEPLVSTRPPCVSIRRSPKRTIVSGSHWDGSAARRRRSRRSNARFSSRPTCSTRSITSAPRAGGRGISTARCRRCALPSGCGPIMPRRATTSASRSSSRDRTAAAIEQLREAVRAGPRWRRRACSSASRFRKPAISTARSKRSRTAVQLDPASADARNSLGLALMQKGEATRRSRRSASWSNSEPANLTARLNLGTALMQAGDLDGAVVSAARRAAAAAVKRRGALQPRGRAEAAGRVRRRRGRAAPGHASSTRPPPKRRFTLGVVLWQTGRGDEAVRAFRDADRAPAGLRRSAFHARHRPEAAGRDCRGAGTPFARPSSSGRRLPKRISASARCSARRDRQRHAAAELAEADRLNRQKADAQASTFAVAVGFRRLKAEGHRRGDRAVPRGHPPRA